MARRKVRNYPSKDYYKTMLDTYFKEHHNEVIKHLLDRLGYADLEALQEDEYRMKWGFDCGWTLLTPKNADMRHEWTLDNGKYDVAIFAHPSYYPQSTTLQRIQVEKAVKDLGLSDIFTISTRLD